MERVIRTIDVWKSYDEDGMRGKPALRGITFDLYQGEVAALYGKSGSGKTTLLNLLAGLDRPNKGIIEIQGLDIKEMGEAGRTEMRRKHLGFIFQFFNLLPTLTAFENVFLSLELAGRNDPDAARESLKLVGLGDKLTRYPHELSGGEQQRVAVARALVKEPAVILADEPTGNLDTQNGTIVLDLLTQRCRDSSTALIMATHTPLTCRYADRVLKMTDGLVVEEDDCPESQP